MTLKPVKLVEEYLRDKLQDHAQIIIKNRTIMVAGETYSGVALYNHKDKSFRFLYASNIETILSNDEDEIFEETDIKEFCKWVSK